MKLKAIVAAVAVLAGSSMASAATLDLGNFVLTYDDTTVLNFVSSSSVGVGSATFEWSLPTGFGVSSLSPATAAASYALPSFSLLAKSGKDLTGVSAFLGNLNYVEAVSTSTTAKVAYDVLIGGTTFNRSFNLNKTQTSPPNGNVVLGNYIGTDTSPTFAASTYSANNVLLQFTATGAGAFIYSDTNNRLRITVLSAVTPVPEPETYAMLLAGVALIGWVAGRHRRH